jgi:SAM-dependent methyltransferase
MIENPDCPCCGGTAWRDLGSRTFRPRHAPKPAWRDIALEILFKVWAPGTTSFTIVYKTCTTCGFVLYAPRPSQDDVTAKYQYSKTTAHGTTIPWDAPREQRRAKRIFNLLAPQIQHQLADVTILDFGGGDGRLLRPFVSAGATCHTIDYTERTIPGVTRLGKTEQDLDPAGPKYDAIICNHVVEHLVAPLNLLRKLQTALKPDGVIYVEVPVEIWRGAPTPWEPVTHINFFVPGSLTDLMRRAGFAVRYSRLSNYPHPHGFAALVVSCVASIDSIDAPDGKGVKDVEALLSPTFGLRMKRQLMLIENFPRALMSKLRVQ